ncbi:aldose epimerase [Romeria aff. gracilis LEGE 07310]|uniref:Aldose epimerase n=1 Tax=Vasconcelosia minhoensis LEGE 07310 TaxID=915328 RepID=A0A8J7AUZ5_9CYAN|nr:aldose epimerase [Romeria gracilis]MBE9075957.1 aldose epimerase [Romeria aff. gracilis LEGE 07310]
MYSIDTQAEQFETYVLRDRDADATLKLVPERGGLVTHWQLQDQQILYFDAERFRDPSRSVRGGIPILFPICGNLPDDRYSYAGKTYPLKQHGFARDLPWQVRDQNLEDSAQLTLALTHSEQTYAAYPFKFELVFTYRLRGNTLEIEQRYTNHSERPMPFSTGLHPYFWVNHKPGLQLDIPASQYQDQIEKTRHAYSGELDWSQNEIDIAFRPINAQQAAAYDPERQLQLVLSWDQAYSTVVFWTVSGKDYFCLEPWSAPRNALNTGTDLLTLAPSETRRMTVTLTTNRR